MVIGEHAVVGSMRYGVRWTEEMLIKALFLFHPELANAGLPLRRFGGAAQQLHPRGWGRALPPSRPPRSGLQRAQLAGGARQLCDTVFERGEVTDVIVVVMPKAPTAIHLDMMFSQVDRELCVVYPPFFVGPERSRRPAPPEGRGRCPRACPTSSRRSATWASRWSRSCAGGEHRTSQEREQWSSACNFLAVRPGTIVSYRRNDATLCELERAGFRIVPVGQLPGLR